MKFLFVCSANVNRGPSFARWFKKHSTRHKVKSCGIYYGYPDKLSPELLSWGDKIYVMDLSQKYFISRTYPMFNNKTEVIGISDQYDPDDVELLKLIEYWANEIKKFRL